jgi:hypothetical protein
MVEAIESRAHGVCLPVYFVDPACPASALLARRWKEGGFPASIWVVEGSPRGAREFREEYGIPEHGLILLATPGPTTLRLRDLGVLATPTSAVVDPRGVVWRVRVTAEPIPVSVVESACPDQIG